MKLSDIQIDRKPHPLPDRNMVYKNEDEYKVEKWYSETEEEHNEKLLNAVLKGGLNHKSGFFSRPSVSQTTNEIG